MKEKEIIENQENNVEEKQYQFRKLKATDIGTMTKLIKKIGISKIKDCFKSEEIGTLMSNFQKEESETEESETEEKEIETSDNSLIIKAGIEAVTQLVQIVIDSYSDCEPELHKLLSDTSNLSLEEVQDLDFEVFIDMLLDFFRKGEFMGFLKRVLKLLGMAD